MQSSNRGEDALVDVLNKLREELSEGNYANIGNLTSLTNNIQFLFAYVRDAFLVVVKQRDQLKQRLSSLQAKLSRKNLEYILDEEKQLYQQFPIRENGLDTLNKRMHSAILQKGDLSGLKRDTLSQKSKRSVQPTIPDKKMSSQEYARATNFVRQQLVGRLQEEPSKSIDLPKNAILNLYLQWSQKHQQPVNYQYLSSIQMALTNQIRRQFPQSIHNSRSFRGIRFRQEYKPLLKTDIKLTQQNQLVGQQSDEESPPLPTFADDHLAI